MKYDDRWYYGCGSGFTDIYSELKAIKATWIARLLTTNHSVKIYIDKVCKALNITKDYLMSTTEILAEHYSILKNFPELYKEDFTCFNLSRFQSK